MRFAARFCIRGFKATIGLWLFSLLLFASADAFSFFGIGENKAKQEPIPPILEPSKTIPSVSKEDIKPNQAEAPSIPPEAMGPKPLPKPTDPVQTLIERNVYPKEWGTRDTPLNRAELADVLVKALKHNLDMVSDFPFYRDVPKSHWAYNAIEVARAKKLLDYRENGFYYPERSITFADVFTAIAHTITGPPPSEDEAGYYLVIYPDWEDIPEELWPAVAKMTRARFFEGQFSPALQLTEEPTPKTLAPYIVSLSHLNERRILLPPSKEALLPYVPGGLTLTISPTVAIFESRLAIGDAVYFSLTEAVDSLPKGSKIRGVVRDALGSHTYVIELVEVETLEEKLFKINGELDLVFRNKALPFIVPGETFQVTTRAPANGTPAQGPPPFSPPVKNPTQAFPAPR